MLEWRRICRDKMAQLCGICCFLAQFVIGRWKQLVDFLRCCTLLKLEVRERIKCVGFQRERNIFFLISKNSLKSAGGRNPSTQGVYKGAPN
jgi:hypothetical protein